MLIFSPINTKSFSLLNYYNFSCLLSCKTFAMKVNVYSFVVTCVIFNVCAGRVFDDKSDAIKEIDKKFNEVEVSANAILQAAENEKKLVTKQGEEELLKYLNTKLVEAKTELEKNGNAIIRTAIVKTKPIAVIYCVRSVLFSNSTEFQVAQNENIKKVLQIRTDKLQKLDFDIYAIKAVVTGLKELLDQAKTKINEGPGVIQDIKKEALNRCESATLLLGDIEICLHEPILTREYVKMRQEIDRSLREMKTKFNTKLDNCLK